MEVPGRDQVTDGEGSFKKVLVPTQARLTPRIADSMNDFS